MQQVPPGEYRVLFLTSSRPVVIEEGDVLVGVAETGRPPLDIVVLRPKSNPRGGAGARVRTPRPSRSPVRASRD